MYLEHAGSNGGRPAGPTGRQRVPIGARSLTGGDIGGVLWHVGGSGSASARGRAVRRSWRISTCGVPPTPRGPRIRGRMDQTGAAPDADGRPRLAEAGEPLRRPHPPIDVTEAAARAGPTIMLGQLGHDHALVVVRGEICVEFLLSVRQHLTSLVDAGVRYVVVDLAEVTACPPRWSANSRQHVGRSTHGTVGCDRSRQPRAWRPRWNRRMSTSCSPSTEPPGRSSVRSVDATGADDLGAAPGLRLFD